VSKPGNYVEYVNEVNIEGHLRDTSCRFLTKDLDYLWELNYEGKGSQTVTNEYTRDLKVKIRYEIL